MKSLISILGVITFFFLASLSTSCYTQRKAQSQVIKADVTYPTIVSGYCAAKFPPKTSTNTITKFVQGETTIDTLIVNDTITNSITKYLTKYRIDTLKVHTIDTIENTAKISQLQAIEDKMSIDLSEANVKIAVLKESKSNWMWLAITLGAIIGAWFGIKYVIPKVLSRI